MCKPGPKSGHIAKRHLIVGAFCTIFGLLLMTTHPVQCGGEGYSSLSWGGVGANKEFDSQALDQLLAKAHDDTLQSGYGQEDPFSFCRLRGVKKRSFHRAHQRALKYGHAWYHGKCMSINQFPHFDSFLKKSESRQHRPSSDFQCPRFSPRHRLNVMHVNVGRLSKPRQSELRLWALGAEFDILVLSETRWNFCSDWRDDHWFYLHSGTPEDKADGLLIMVRTTVCDESQLGFLAPVPGRLGHLRIMFDRRSVDLLCVYQYADDHSNARLRQRSLFWSSLDSSLATMPRRNMFLLAGDFSCSLGECQQVGTSKYTWLNAHCQGPRHRDMQEFHTILSRYHLTALNTWSAKAPPTFQNGVHSSRELMHG
eukprot:s4108_g5.t1